MALLSHITANSELTPNIKRILTNPQDPVSGADRKTAKNKVKKHFLTYVTEKRLFLFFAVLIGMFILVSSAYHPSSAQAGFLKSVSQTINPNSTPVINTMDFNSQDVPILSADSSPNPQYGMGGGDITVTDNAALVPESGPLGVAGNIQDQPSNNQISTYLVQSGDTISQIAQMFDVSVNTIVWANDLHSQILQPGQTLVILPVSGILYSVKSGDTLQSIAKKYGGDVYDIMQFNNIASGTALTIGDQITIPDGELANPISGSAGVRWSSSGSSSGSGRVYTANGHTFFLASDGSSEPVRGTGGPSYPGYYMKPVNGVLTQGLHGYNAVDLGAPIGTPIWAAAAGEVIVSKMGGWNGGYGNYVVISHGNGTQTLYAHMKETVVSVGEEVAQGQVIGYVGITGMTTGPHVHFEVRGAYNPFQ
jgi:murein DD-endopeptidase MepM/ murein hydrolase activator NlpD